MASCEESSDDLERCERGDGPTDRAGPRSSSRWRRTSRGDGGAVAADVVQRRRRGARSNARERAGRRGSSQESTIVQENQRFMAHDLRARTRSYPVDHAPAVAAPSLVLDIVREAVEWAVAG